MDKKEKIYVSEEDIAAFKEWMRQEPTMPDELEEQFIRCMLISRKGSLHEAKKKFIDFRRIAQLDPRILGDGDMQSDEMVAFFPTTAFCYMPKKTPEGYTVFVGKVLSTEATCFSLQLMVTQLIYTTLHCIFQDDFGNCESSYVWDVSNLRMGHIKTFSFELFSTLIQTTKVCPLRVKAVVFIGMPSYAEFLHKIIAKAVPAKVAERSHIISNYEDLHEIIPKEVLPKDFGGDQAPIEEIYREQLAKLQSYTERFKEECAKIAEERKLLNISNIPNIETFRKCDFD